MSHHIVHHTSVGLLPRCSLHLSSYLAECRHTSACGVWHLSCLAPRSLKPRFTPCLLIYHAPISVHDTNCCARPFWMVHIRTDNTSGTYPHFLHFSSLQHSKYLSQLSYRALTFRGRVKRGCNPGQEPDRRELTESDGVIARRVREIKQSLLSVQQFSLRVDVFDIAAGEEQHSSDWARVSRPHIG